MSSQWAFHGCDADMKANLEAFWAKRWPRLQKQLALRGSEVQDVQLIGTCPPKARPPRCEVWAVVHLPTGTLTAEGSDEDPQTAVDLAADAFRAEITRLRSRDRKDYVFRRKARRRADLEAAAKALQRAAEAGRRDEFLRLLRPHLDLLRDHARRELRILELQGVFHKGEVTVADLLDEVLVRAWERFADRPRRQLYLWLTRLLHEILLEWVKQEPRPHESVEEEVWENRPDEAPQVDEQEWWRVLLGDVETLRLEDLIPDAKATDAWEELDAKEQRDRLLSLLGELPTEQRQAFLLHALEDYDTGEIAKLQGRPVTKVREDIEKARRRLRDQFLADGPVRESGKSVAAAASGKAR